MSATEMASDGTSLSACLHRLSHSAAELSALSELSQVLISTVKKTGLEARLVGSCGAGLATRGSDLDFVLLPSDDVADDEEAVLARIKRALDDRLREVVIVVTRSKAPSLVTGVDPDSGVRCDFSFRHGSGGGKAGVDKALLLRDMCAASVHLAPLAKLVKAWARARRLIDSANGQLNAFTWALMCGGFLQACELLPVLDVAYPSCASPVQARLAACSAKSC